MCLFQVSTSKHWYLKVVNNWHKQKQKRPKSSWKMERKPDYNFRWTFLPFSLCNRSKRAFLSDPYSWAHLDCLLTMFLKWALRVPVVWWYSITQLLFRISPLLSLNERQLESELITLSGCCDALEWRKWSRWITLMSTRCIIEVWNFEHF